MVWESNHDSDLGELCDAGDVPTMWGYLHLWSEMWDAKGRENLIKSVENVNIALQNNNFPLI